MKIDNHELADLRVQKLDRLRCLTSSILDARRPAHLLEREVVATVAILAESATVPVAIGEDILDSEMVTANGLALSPASASMCANDFVRTIQFIRSVHSAALDVRALHPDRPARVLYAGCGPYATLAVPIMSVLSSREVTFTLLDIHAESIESAKSVVDSLGLADSVASSETMDASLYCGNREQAHDVILVEMMQACLESEPQVAIARHLVAQNPNAILIPEDVRVDLTLADMSREFERDALKPQAGDAERDRIHLGSVFVLSRETINSWKAIGGDRLPGSTMRIPDLLERRYQPMLLTTIRIYRDHVLKDYESGLTCPRVFSAQGTLDAGATIQFHYELGRHPRLSGEVCAR